MNDLDDDAFPQDRPELAPTDYCKPGLGNEYIVLVNESADPEALGRQVVDLFGGTFGETFSIINGFVATLPDRAVEALRRHPDVQSLECSQTDIPPPN